MEKNRNRDRHGFDIRIADQGAVVKGSGNPGIAADDIIQADVEANIGTIMPSWKCQIPGTGICCPPAPGSTREVGCTVWPMARFV